MIDFAQRSLEALGSSRAGSTYVILTGKLAGSSFEAFASHRQKGFFLWAPGELARSSDDWCIAGSGELARADGTGADRWRIVRESAARVLSDVSEAREPGLVAPRVRFFGGGAFHPSVADPIWASFGAASFVLPRWSYGVRGDDAFVRFAFARAELEDRAKLFAEIESMSSLAGRVAAPSGPASSHSSPPPDNDASWTPLIEEALRAIGLGGLEKIVVARRTWVAERISTSATLARLRAQNPQATAFAFERDGKCFVGATPERLIFAEKGRVLTEALAGTIARGNDDDAAIAALLSSEKDLREHRIVVHGIERALEPFAKKLDVPTAPRIRTLGRVHHLATPITAELVRETHVLELVEALHPTPALSGFPKADAFDWISKHEPFERGWYGAPIGWFDDAGEGSFAVAIRSALVAEDGTWMFAGNGIVKGSEPDAELAETRWKLKTMSEALVRA